MKKNKIAIIFLLIIGVLLINNKVHNLGNVFNSKLSEEDQIVIFLNNKYNKDFKITQTVDVSPFNSYNYYDVMCDGIYDPIHVKVDRFDSQSIKLTENYLSIKYKEDFASYFQNTTNGAFNNAFVQNRNIAHVPSFFSNYDVLNDNTTFDEYIHNVGVDVEILLNENDFHSVKQIDKLIQSLEQEHLTYEIYLFVFYDEDFESALESNNDYRRYC